MCGLTDTLNGSTDEGTRRPFSRFLPVITRLKYGDFGQFDSENSSEIRLICKYVDDFFGEGGNRNGPPFHGVVCLLVEGGGYAEVIAGNLGGMPKRRLG